MPTLPTRAVPPRGEQPPLPSEDALLRAPDLTLDALAQRWSACASRAPMTAEQMRGADVRAQRLGTPAQRLMDEAGTAVAVAVRALLGDASRDGPVLVLAGPGNNGGDGHVAARVLAGAGIRTAVVLVSADARPGTADASVAWETLEAIDGVQRIQAGTARDVRVLRQGIERAGAIVDALLGTGVRGRLRDPIRAAVELARHARSLGVPILAVDTPTSVDLTSGAASDPVVRADVTVTFHRPKHGLSTRTGRALAGRVLVAPIGIPAAADPT